MDWLHDVAHLHVSVGKPALSVMWTTNSTLWALVMSPLALLRYRTRLIPDGAELQSPLANSLVTHAVLLMAAAVAI